MSVPLVLLVLSAWPSPGSVLVAPKLTDPPAKKLKVLVDAGHGVAGNEGNHGCFCQAEADTTLDEAHSLASRLQAMGRFEVRLARDADHPAYPQRIQAAEAWADVVVSLHTDARGEAFSWQPWDDERVCYRNTLEPGFAVLWSEEGSKAIVDARARLGHAMCRRLRATGLTAYSGVNYEGLYREDEAGCWIDVHEQKKRIFFLRASAKVPIVIIETHHALDPEEVQRWKEPKTLEVFATAVAAGLSEFVK